jgi:hypothetical protein
MGLQIRVNPLKKIPVGNIDKYKHKKIQIYISAFNFGAVSEKLQ